MNPFAQELLENARKAHDPSALDRARVSAKLAARIAAEPAGATTVTASLGGVLKVGVPVLLAALAAGWIATRGGTGGHGSAADGVVPLASVTVATPAPAQPAPVSPPDEATEPATAGAGAEVAAVAPPPAPPVPARSSRPSVVASTDLAGEMALLASAQAAIQSGDYATALAKLDEHQRAYPSGVLGEERTAARVVALCGAGRQAEARSLAAAFLAKHPSSPLAPRVRSSCGAQ